MFESSSAPQPAEKPSRDDLATMYLDQLLYPPYPVQEDAILKWYASDTGVLVSAPTGTGKTVIAEAAVFEALHTNTVVYYTTPLIALTDQKFYELQETVQRWGFKADDVGLVTGNRRVNPGARVLVVVAEILLNRLLHAEDFAFDNVSGVVMDEFHNFSDPERGLVWEFALALLPAHVRLLLLSATIGNANPFITWLQRAHGRRLELSVGTERKVPLSFRWIGDELLPDLLETLADGEPEQKKTPALVFCFNREECWSLAEELKGRHLVSAANQKEIAKRLDEHEFGPGVGAKLKPILLRGVGVHHAGMLPRHRRLVEDLFQAKLLSYCICTETLAAGINLPARSVVIPCLLKGPPGAQKLIDSSSAHQIFGRAGRPQFDKEGFVYALPHEDDVRLQRWKEKYDQIPEDTKDPLLIKAKKAMKKKMPVRSATRQYWNEAQFEKLRLAPPKDLQSQGQLPWRLLAYLLKQSSDVSRIRTVIKKRLMEQGRINRADAELDAMLLTLADVGFVTLSPPPPKKKESEPAAEGAEDAADQVNEEPTAPAKVSWLSQQLQQAIDAEQAAKGKPTAKQLQQAALAETPQRYMAEQAEPTPQMDQLFAFRGVNPLYGVYLNELFATADATERLLLLESVLEFPRALLKNVRVPHPESLPPGPLALTVLDDEVVSRGLLPAGDLYPPRDQDVPFEERKYPPTLAEKARWIFDARYPGVDGLNTTAVYVAAGVLEFGGDFAKFVSARDLTKQEGLVFRHLLRLVLLLGEFAQLTPPGKDSAEWKRELRELGRQLTASCEAVDPSGTKTVLAPAAVEEMGDSVVGPVADVLESEFGDGIL
jgi:superfamily II DNA/RNA helicase